jgi:phospholipase/carboxylesterase
MLEKIVVNATKEHRASVIWMHGLGADGHDFQPVVHALNLPHVRFILPHAPHRPVTLNNGYEMRAWYDIIGLGGNSPQDEAGIKAMQLQINALIEHEISLGIPANKIMLAGFSQGGAMALHTALRYPKALAGILALSTYLPLKPLLSQEKNNANHNIPIFMAHGQFDSIISLETAKASAQALKENGYTINWHEYPMAHSVSDQEIRDIGQFLRATLDVANGSTIT